MENGNNSAGRNRKRAAPHFAEYIENTTIHGIKYLGEKHRPITEKIFWILIFVVCFILLGYFVQDMLQKWNQNSAILVEDDQPTPIYSIPFPAVTICPAVKIKNEFFDRADMDMNLFDLMPLICNQNFQNVLQRDLSNSIECLNQSYIELLHKISPNEFEILKYITFASKSEIKYNIGTNETFVESPFSYILTNEGKCFTFNLPSDIIIAEPSLQNEYIYHNIENATKFWDINDGYYGYPNFPRAVWGSGFNTGLHVVLESAYEDLFTICQPTKIGYKIILHSPTEYPSTFEKFISIPHNTMAQIKVTPKITRTSYELRKYSPQVRKCFFDGERQLKYYKFYNRANCKLDCLARYTRKQYGCIHFSLPRSANESICGPRVNIHKMYDTEENMNSYFEYRTKVNDVFETVLEDEEPNGFKQFSNFHCNCLPACNSLEYEYSVDMEDIDLEKLTEKNSRKKSISKYIAVIDIFFGATTVTGMTRKQFYTFSDLISNIGGLVGLFMGASIISIFEIVYFFVVRNGGFASI